MKHGGVLLLSSATLFGVAHNFALKLLVYSAVGCFYAADCVFPTWQETAISILWFPASMLSRETRAALSSSSPETEALMVSLVWGLAFLLVGFVVLSFWRARRTRGNVV